MTKRIVFSLGVLCIFALVLAVPQHASAQPCTLTGTYIFKMTGSVFAALPVPSKHKGKDDDIKSGTPSNPEFDFAAVGSMAVFPTPSLPNGLLINESISIDGTITRQYTHQGRYTINPDGLGGSLQIFSQLAGRAVNYDFLFASACARLVIIGIDQDTVISGEAIRP